MFVIVPGPPATKATSAESRPIHHLTTQYYYMAIYRAGLTLVVLRYYNIMHKIHAGPVMYYLQQDPLQWALFSPR